MKNGVKKILLIITGSVAAYKAVELLRLLQKRHYDVSVILTKAAQEFVTPLLVATIAKNKIYTELFDDGQHGMAHINLSRDNDLIVVAPASADFIAKMANGYADDLASTVILAANKKIIIAPAMNEKMWLNQATLHNIETLTKSGIMMIAPNSDELACGETGIGKMQEPAIIIEEINKFFINQNVLSGKKILITGGATRENIDTVRFISNDSSGKQALLLVKVLKEMGADIELVCANISATIPLPENKISYTKTAAEMFEAVKEKLPQSDVFIGCAAVADYKVKNPSTTKIKKEDNANLHLDLEKNIDILEYVANAPNRPTLVIGFAAESENLRENALKKLQHKNCDFILANDVEKGRIFGSDKSRAMLIGKDFEQDFGKIKKEEIAKILAQKIASICQQI